MSGCRRRRNLIKSRHLRLRRAWTRAYIYVNSALKHPVAYVRDSSGDENIDAASIAAAESLDVCKIADKLAHGTIIEFTFDYMVKRPEGIPHAMHPRSEHRYREYRNLLTWQQKHLGPDHPEVAINLTSAAALLKESSNNAQAETALAKAWENLAGERNALWRNLLHSTGPMERYC